MPPYAAFHMGLHCLPKYLFVSSQDEKCHYLSSTSNMLYKVCNCNCLRCVNVIVRKLRCDNLYIINKKKMYISFVVESLQ